MSDKPNPWRQRLDAARAEGLAAREYFVIFSEPTGDRAVVKEYLKVHLAYQRQLEARHVLVAAGPLSNSTGDEWTGKGMIILRANTIEEAREIADADPMHLEGARKYTLLPWLMNEGSFTLNVQLAAQKVEFL